MKIGYARVSTGEQTHALQLDALTAAGCDQVFEDTISGAVKAPPGLTAALAATGEGDTLVVWRTDRLGRSTVDLILLLDELRGRGVAFQSLMEGIDTTTAAGRAMFSMIGVFAELERNLLAERTKAGIAAARRRGAKIGRPGKLAPDQLDYAREKIAGGEGKAVTAARLGVDASTLRRLLKAGKLH